MADKFEQAATVEDEWIGEVSADEVVVGEERPPAPQPDLETPAVPPITGFARLRCRV